MRNIPERWIHRVASELRRPVRLDDEFDRGVMDAVRAMPRHRHRPWTRMFRSRTITVSPMVTGIAAALLLAVALSASHFVGAWRANRASTRVDGGTGRSRGTKPRGVRSSSTNVRVPMNRVWRKGSRSTSSQRVTMS